MDAARPRSGSVPRDYKKITHILSDYRFVNIDQASELILQLRALDTKLESMRLEEQREFDFDFFLQYGPLPSTPRPASEAPELLILLRKFPTPVLIPRVFLDAYKAALHGRPFVNEWNISDFRMGRDPTCSSVLAILRLVDNLLHTSLKARFDALDATVAAFPFLNLPAELRLQVYSHLFPRDTPLALAAEPIVLPKQQPVKIHLDILRTNHQLHDEVTEHFYAKRTLYITFHRSNPNTSSLCREWAALYYETVATLPPRARAFFHNVIMHTPHMYSPYRKPPQRRYPEIETPENSLKEMFELLPNLSEIQFVRPRSVPMPAIGGTKVDDEMKKVITFVYESVPKNVKVCPIQG
ncbi:hypothetical protein CC80DRAFT_487068 [Byssothecium circinans]|uniref:F-box domain-containing protein n=1 Tax=Byssothecium circinans TaxID=147558 RepID=A0A6A5UG28_9PLEO|nr:hypothetical protein CC80DRAFT_487068 [Byssothecium circinans]